jgi:hypothetical protein
MDGGSPLTVAGALRFAMSAPDPLLALDLTIRETVTSIYSGRGEDFVNILTKIIP